MRGKEAGNSPWLAKDQGLIGRHLSWQGGYTVRIYGRVAHMMLVVNTSNALVCIFLTLVFCSSAVASAGSIGRSVGVDAVYAITK